MDPDPDELLAKLFASDQRFRFVFPHERDAISVFDAKTHRFMDVNEAWVGLYGYSRQEALGMTPADVSDEQEATRAAIAERAARSGTQRVDLRWHKKKDGTRFPVELICGNVKLGGRDAIYSVIRDITERVRADEALRRSEANFRALIERISCGVFVHRFGKLVYVNPAGLELLGYTGHAEELIGRESLDFVHPDDREIARRRISECANQSKPVPLREQRFLRRDGSCVTAEVNGIPVEFDGDTAALGLLQDVTARKRMEAQLVMSDRLASLGRLAASVGHEINNPLAYVLGNAQMLKRDVSRLEPGACIQQNTLDQFLEQLSAIEQGSERVRDIVRDLKTLAQKDDEARGAVDLQGVLDAAAEMAGHEIRHRARLVKDYGEPLLADASKGRLGQVFLNLLINAAQAIPAGNALDNEVRIVTRRRGADQVVVEISDTGVGIEASERGRIFEPFYSTKGLGGGTGLGLSICHHLVSSLGGSIEVQPHAPRGTTFRVTLPAARPVSAEPPAEIEEPRPIAGGRLLVVDDEEPFAKVLASFLEGYEVTLAHSGRRAIELLDNGARFDAILCDLMMSDLTGMDVYEHLARKGTGAERTMIFMTGGAFTPRSRKFLDSVDNPRLDKPFQPAAITRAIRELLTGPSAR